MGEIGDNRVSAHVDDNTLRGGGLAVDGVAVAAGGDGERMRRKVGSAYENCDVVGGGRVKNSERGGVSGAAEVGGDGGGGGRMDVEL